MGWTPEKATSLCISVMEDTINVDNYAEMVQVYGSMINNEKALCLKIWSKIIVPLLESVLADFEDEEDIKLVKQLIKGKPKTSFDLVEQVENISSIFSIGDSEVALVEHIVGETKVYLSKVLDKLSEQYDSGAEILYEYLEQYAGDLGLDEKILTWLDIEPYQLVVKNKVMCKKSGRFVSQKTVFQCEFCKESRASNIIGWSLGKDKYAVYLYCDDCFEFGQNIVNSNSHQRSNRFFGNKIKLSNYNLTSSEQEQEQEPEPDSEDNTRAVEDQPIFISTCGLSADYHPVTDIQRGDVEETPVDGVYTVSIGYKLNLLEKIFKFFKLEYDKSSALDGNTHCVKCYSVMPREELEEICPNCHSPQY